jgi:glutamate/tyrosine decarboxylase-like PLP-dependent enzyme
MHWQSPRFFAYFAANTSPPGILAEMLIGALNMIGFSWQSSPISSELEMVSQQTREAQCLALLSNHPRCPRWAMA